MHLDDFNYILPKELVAQSPADKTAQSKLLLSDNKKIIAFKSLVDNLTDKDILVFNDTKVMPVVIKGSLNNKEIKVTLLESLGSCKWKAFIKPAKKVNLGDVIEFRDGLNLRVNKNNLVGKAQLIFFSNDTMQNSMFKFWNLKNSFRLERLFKNL